MLDTNIVLDVFLARQPFYENAKRIFELCYSKKIIGFVSASTITDIFYCVRKEMHSREQAYSAIGRLLQICRVAMVTETDVKQAYIRHAKDFEDCLLATCAQSQGCDYIVTRNKKDFADLPVKAVEPEEFLTILTL